MNTKLTTILTLTFAFTLDVNAGSATWNANPAGTGWNRPADWTPKTVPNGPSDAATFAQSSVTDLSISSAVEVNGITFAAGGDAFTIDIIPAAGLTISGVGITNNSGVLQNFVMQEDESSSGAMYFTNSATAGDSIVYTNQTLDLGGKSPLIQFEDSATAGSAQFYNYTGNTSTSIGVIEFQGNSSAANGTFRNTGTATYYDPYINFRDQASAGQAVITNEAGAAGFIVFYDTSTADHATITNEAGFASDTFFLNESTAGNATIINQAGSFSVDAGYTFFEDNSTVGNGTVIAEGAGSPVYGYGRVILSATARAGSGSFVASGGQISKASGGLIILVDSATAENATFNADGGQVTGAKGGDIDIQNTATAEAGIFYANGTTVEGALGGRVKFAVDTPTAAEATLIATSGVGTEEGAGGGIVFRDSSTGGQARVEVFGNGFLDLTGLDLPGLTIGSLEGDGLVFLGGANLSIGSSNLSTTFSGVIAEGNSEADALTKIGTGTLSLSGANTYIVGTTVNSGVLRAMNPSGSATGTGPVSVNSGTLGGKGIITGPVTIGTGSGAGAVLQPSVGVSQPVKLTLQSSVTFKGDSTYTYKLSTQKTKADQVVANGVTIESGAQFNFTALANKRLAAGTVFTANSNTAATPISGTFANLADDSTLTAGPNKLLVSYTGGAGNDLTLTVVPPL